MYVCVYVCVCVCVCVSSRTPICSNHKLGDTLTEQGLTGLLLLQLDKHDLRQLGFFSLAEESEILLLITRL
jgi:hypothetical protein